MGLTAAYNAEAAVIGSVLIQPELFAEASARLRGEDFQHPLCREAFEAMYELCCEGRAVDPLTVLSVMGDTPANREGLLALAQGVPSTVNFSCYAGIVVEQRQRRTAAAAARQIAEALEPEFEIGEPLPIQDCAAMAGQLLQAFEGREQQEAKSLEVLFREYDERQGRPLEFFKTGIGPLDKGVRIRGGHFIIVAGRPSSGKTALTLQIALHMAARYRVVYFSLETSDDEPFHRALACHAGVPIDSVMLYNTTPQDQARINRAREDMPRLDVHFISAAGWSVAQIRAKAIAMKADVIFVDYLGLIRPSGGTSRYEAVTQISIDLHTAAQSTGIAVVALSQLNRTGVGMAALRESGQVEQDADAIIMLSQPDEENPQSRKIRVEKNKTGERGEIDISFFGNLQRFGIVDNYHHKQVAMPLPPASQADFEETGEGDYPWQ